MIKNSISTKKNQKTKKKKKINFVIYILKQVTKIL